MKNRLNPKIIAKNTRRQDIKSAELSAVRSDAFDRLRNVRANVIVKYNRAQRRNIAKQCGIFKHRGLFAGIFGEDQKNELNAKTKLNSKMSIKQVLAR